MSDFCHPNMADYISNFFSFQVQQLLKGISSVAYYRSIFPVSLKIIFVLLDNDDPKGAYANSKVFVYFCYQGKLIAVLRLYDVCYITADLFCGKL